MPAIRRLAAGGSGVPGSLQAAVLARVRRLGDEVEERIVGFMTDRADDGRGTCCDGPQQCLVGERE